jgi:uncharacterized protein YwqG
VFRNRYADTSIGAPARYGCAMTGEFTNRRGLLTGAFARAARIGEARLKERASLIGPFAIGDDDDRATGSALPRTRASTRKASISDLLAAADELGLGARHAELRAAVRVSAQMAPSRLADGPVRFGGEARLPQGVAWPAAAGRPLRLLAQVDLSRIPSDGLPFDGQGTLLFFFDTDWGSHGREAAEPERGRVLHVGRDVETVPAAGPALPRRGGAGEVSCELRLPRVWSRRIDALDLTDDERYGWERLREHLAEWQGTDSIEQVASDSRVSHRLFGVPDDTRGDMPLICELCDRGERIVGHALTHPQADEAEAKSDRWELLAQFSRDAELGWNWSESAVRIYFWCDHERLAAGDFSRIWTVAR